MKLQYKQINLRTLKAIDDERGGYEGTPSPFGELDLGGDVILKGAFRLDLPDFRASGWGGVNHDWSTHGQIAYPVEAKETDDGLFVKMRFHSTADAQAQRVKIAERLDDGLAVKLSIGYELLDSLTLRSSEFASELPRYIRADRKQEILARAAAFSRIRILKRIKLYEVSIVTVPMEPLAVVTDVKQQQRQQKRAVVSVEFLEQAIEQDVYETLALARQIEVEHLLREVAY